MSKKILLFLSLILLLSLSSLTKVHADGTEPFQATFQLNLYADTKIVVSYAFTQNVSSTANSAGKSVWRTNIDPYTATFSTSAYDRFTWQLTILYNIIIAQQVTIAIFSGTLPVTTQEYSVKTNSITFIFTMSVTEQPRPPTAEEYAQASYNLFVNQMNEWIAGMKQQNEMSRQHDYAQWIVIAAFTTVTIVCSLIPYLKRKERRE